jgi:high affinity Mn2+ porin
MRLILFCVFVFASSLLFSQDLKDTTNPWNFHFQLTAIAQNNFHFHSPYAGLNSFVNPSAQAATSLTSTAFVGRRLWKNASAFFNPEMSGGAGISGTRGIAGFPNGETFRVGDPSPVVYLARLYLDQYFPIGNETEVQEDEANQLQLTRPKKFYRIIAGKFCLADFFDDNNYSHDPRTQFLNWSLMSAGAWDYPANVRGYTVGIVQQLQLKDDRFSIGATLEPKDANGPKLNYDITKAIGLTAEWKHSFRKGEIHSIFFYNTANMGDYKLALQPIYKQDVTQTRKHGRSKIGGVFSGEYPLSKRDGIFWRFSINDGKHETWAFTEIDHSASAGYVVKTSKKRADDEIGIAAVVNGISGAHQRYLSIGGYGFIIGDGQLNYAPEAIAEAYYKWQLFKNFSLSPNIQYVVNPAYNKDRGPVFLFALRGHFSL